MQITFQFRLYPTHKQEEKMNRTIGYPEYKEVHSQVLQDCLQRLDDAYQRFFRGEAGYPRYKSADRYVSFT
ncbi:helix-turn-helix domain-containing protein [Paenibacillus beijingensis]|uniref:Transposase putative helix-turn-helix domain-containing protein n=1 Tax=Paenibacillus beijingensis TaxID=1126833 RepID=A0A0D5NNK8_9BACL|nr:helix-turn-helix domain-containing protein [Paenibacillus beijingensis]AJY76856.1 hypothetical protein VN24_22705 [Paenibacillus beijingensis]